jgi:XTP/dITP diphosphohydrolase
MSGGSPTGIVFATSNLHKLEEVRRTLEPMGFDVLGLADLAGGGAVPEPPEDGATFTAIARDKAIAYARALGRTCLAEDSGLEVDALGGAPGVLSARYAGATGTRAERDAANNRKLLEAMRHVPPERRSARFVCAMCLADAAGTVLAETRGTFEGAIASRPAGSNGFGYDPLLLLPGECRTSAQLTPAEKDARSHRGAAARAMARSIAALARRRAGQA